MTVASALSLVLLVIAGVVAVISACGLLALRSSWQRIHLLAPLGVVVPLLVLGAILIRSGLSSNAVAAALVGVGGLISSALMAHVLARALAILGEDARSPWA